MYGEPQGLASVLFNQSQSLLYLLYVRKISVEGAFCVRKHKQQEDGAESVFMPLCPILVNTISQERLCVNFFKYGANVQLDSRRNRLEFGGQRSKVKVGVAGWRPVPVSMISLRSRLRC